MSRKLPGSAIVPGTITVTELKAALTYREKRWAEYPSAGEQFDMIYHQGFDAWKAMIDGIKAKYPKPT